MKWAQKAAVIFLRNIAGPCFVLGGIWFILLPFAFASMQDPDKPLSWSEYLGLIIRGGSGSFVIGLTLLVFGAMLARIRSGD